MPFCISAGTECCLCMELSGIQGGCICSSGSKANSLDELRKTKDAEIEKYKKYLNKAKKIIESFGEGKSRAAEDSLEVCVGEGEVPCC